MHASGCASLLLYVLLYGLDDTYASRHIGVDYTPDMADVASAVIAGLSGITGAALGGFFTYRVALQQVTMTQKLREKEWDRADIVSRRDRYAQFTASASQVMDYWLRPPVVRDSADLEEKRYRPTEFRQVDRHNPYDSVR